MPAYQLQIKQVVDYPRCRIYRQFIHRLIDDRSIRASGGSGLFHYTVLCSFANFRTSYRRIDGISYTVYPGEWVCTLKELSQWFRTRFQCQALSILGELQQRHLIDFSSLGRGNVIRYKIRNWARHNTVLEYNAPCQKDTGFFFLPVSIVTDLISSDRCSEMDIVLDLWVSAIYNDSQVQGSGLGPVAYFRNGTGNPLVTYTELAARWGLSRATVGRILKKLSALDYISLMSFPGRHGSVIYLKNYLSTMFEISDVMVDKEEVAMTLNIRLELPAEGCVDQEEPTMEHEVIVSDELSSVSKSHIEIIMQKMAQILMAQGISCFGCSLSHYKLYPLSGDCREELLPRAHEQTVLRLPLLLSRIPRPSKDRLPQSPSAPPARRRCRIPLLRRRPLFRRQTLNRFRWMRPRLRILLRRVNPFWRMIPLRWRSRCLKPPLPGRPLAGGMCRRAVSPLS